MIIKTLLSGTVLALLVALPFFGSPQDDPLTAADKAFDRKEYAAALAGYRTAEKLPEFAKDRDHIGIRIGVTLARLERFDEALASLEQFVREKPDSLGAARGLVERGVIAATMPHNAYEKDGKRTRGNWIQGATYVWTAAQDFKAAIDDLQRAGDLIAPLFAQAVKDNSPERARLGDDLMRARLEFAAAIEAGWTSLDQGGPPATTTKPGRWDDRMIAAFDAAIEAGKSLDSREPEALARYLKGAACVRLLNQYSHYEVKAGGDFLYRRQNEDDTPLVKLPADRNPLAVLTEAVARSKDTKLAIPSTMALASFQQQVGLYVDAVKTYESVVKADPKNPYADDARSQIEAITFPRVALQPTHAELPARAFTIVAQIRNVKELSVTVSSIPLDAIYRSERWLSNGETSFGSAQETYDAAAKMGALTRQVAAFVHPTGDDGTHQPREQKLAIPALDAGGYIVEAKSGELVWRSLVVVSDLSAAAKFDRDQYVAFAVDASTGKPVAGAQVVVRQKRHENQRVYVKNAAGATDARGLFAVGREFRDAWVNVECFVSDGARMALIDQAYWHVTPREHEGTVAYLMTDRPVYRPGDPIRVAAVVRQRLQRAPSAAQPGMGEVGELEYQPLSNRGIRMTIRDPKGQQIFDQTLKTDDSGAFSQEIKVEKEAPLGVYHVQLSRDGTHFQSSGFRIEEYLKPEFEVTVGLPKEQVRLGSKVPVTVDAQYYFGGGVPGAEVTWRVFREEYFPTFPWRHQWMFGNESRRPSHRREGRELVVSGQGSLSSGGTLPIEFDTARYSDVAGEGSNFIVEADVMDSSRRTISGSATLLLAKRALVLGVAPRRGFYMAGDNVECETMSKLPAGGPIAASGMIRVFKITPAVKPDGTPDETRTLIYEEPHATDQKGIGFFRWQPDAGGYFAIVFEAPDRFEQMARGEARLWIYKPGADYREFAFANIELVADRRTFEIGQTAKVLVKSALPDGAVFYSIDAGDRMLKWDTLILSGKLGVIEVPIDRAAIPNIHVHVLAVSGGKFFEDKIELFVPPDDRFLDVSLAFAKDAYQPGESGDLVVTTKTSTGAPVAARLAVTVLDASILAIQADESQDIRQFFYGARRYPNIQRDSSAGVQFGGYLAHDVKWGRYDTVDGLPAWNGPAPGFVSRLWRGEGFGLRELEAFGVDKAGASKKTFGGVRRGRTALGTPAGAGAVPAAKAVWAEGGEKLKDGDAAGAPAEEKMDSADDAVAGEDAAEPPQARKDFRDSALWTAAVATDASGKATLKVPFPESLTTWRAKAWAWTNETLVGQTTADVKTTKDVLVRLRAPRFFVEGDTITVAALVNNRTAKAQQARVRITFDGEHLESRDPLEVAVNVAANADRRVDWTVNVLRAGETKITAQVIADAGQDALEMTYPVLEWGKNKVLTQGAVLEGDAMRELEFLIPAERRVETTALELLLQPSLALTLLEALPYLIDFPYGCTEQTTSRFIPAVIVAKILGDSGVTLEDIAAARAVPREREKDHARVITSAVLHAAVRTGLDRLASMQHPDGGFGWWKDDRSSPYLTAYVLQGLQIAREADLPVAPEMLERAYQFLAGVVSKEERVEQATFISYVLARAGKADKAVLDRIFKNRDALNVYGKALLASAMKAAGRNEEAAMTLHNLADFASRDVANGTAHWMSTSREWWWWWNNLIETNAAVLNAFVDVEPNHELVRPLVKWLVMNRRGSRWTNTRDTAQCVLALARYAKTSGELDPNLTFEVSVNGGAPATRTIDKKNALLFDGRLLFGPEVVATGPLKVSIKTQGKGRLYVSGSARFFTKESDITASGNELFVERSYVRVLPKAESRTENGRPVTAMVDTFEPLSPGAEIKAGDVVEVRLKIDAKNDYDYLFFEDMKPSGFEPLEVKSGARYGNGICSNVEYRDTRTAMFVTYLQQGTHDLTYRLRAEVPGTLRVLPARGEAMYAPEIAGTSSSFRITVIDKTER